MHSHYFDVVEMCCAHNSVTLYVLLTKAGVMFSSKLRNRYLNVLHEI